MNLLIFTADDMSFWSTGFAGCEFPEITPRIDRLAAEGVFFNNAHTTIGLCQPSRSVLMTGLYPWNNGALGFEPIRLDVPTFVEILTGAGYTTGIIGKIEHLAPPAKFPWHYKQSGYTGKPELGKSPIAYYRFCKNFLKDVSPPFFLMANSHFPHRDFPQKSRYDPAQVSVPGFLPDTPGIREEIARYDEGVSMCDYTLSLVLQSLEESDHSDTLIVFTSDHGMAFPFVKANCYHFSTHIPLIFSHPDLPVKRENNFVGGVDLMPTLLDLLNLPCPTTDGKSYKKAILEGEPFCDYVYTCLSRAYSGVSYETRGIHNSQYCYVNNFWSDGEKAFHEDGALDGQLSVIDLKHCRPELYNRLRYRTTEEFYDILVDPHATRNMLGNESYRVEMARMKKLMKTVAKGAKDTVAMEHLQATFKI